MKNLKSKVIDTIIKVLVLFFVLILFVVGVVGWRLYENGRQVYVVRKQQILSLMESHPQFFNEVFEVVLPKAAECKGEEACVQEVRSRLDSLVSLVEMPTSSVSNASEPSYFSQVSLLNDQPMYFIQFKNDSLIKLFFSGELVITQVKTSGESKVKDLLSGTKSDLYGLQANLEGLRMTYLNDLYSEAEVIVPYKKENKIIGAVVYLHGD